MKLKVAAMLAGMMLLCAGAARSEVIYQFSFTNLQGSVSGNFGLTLTYADYVTTTGMQQLPGVLNDSAASLGYGVAYAGTNNIGMWGFDDDSAAILTDGFFVNNGNSFIFMLNPFNNGYYSAPGIYSGRVAGNASNLVEYFYGDASLTIRETGTEVPEPASLALLGLGLAGLALSRRRA